MTNTRNQLLYKNRYLLTYKYFKMKQLAFSFLILFSLSVAAQEADEIKPAAKGVVYGTVVSEKN